MCPAIFVSRKAITILDQVKKKIKKNEATNCIFHSEVITIKPFSPHLLMCLELSCLFSPLSDMRFKSCSVPLLKSDLLLRVAMSMFISSVNHRRALPAGPVAMGLWGNLPPHQNSSPLTHTRSPWNCWSVRAWLSHKLPVYCTQIGWY